MKTYSNNLRIATIVIALGLAGVMNIGHTAEEYTFNGVNNILNYQGIDGTYATRGGVEYNLNDSIVQLEKTSVTLQWPMGVISDDLTQKLDKIIFSEGDNKLNLRNLTSNAITVQANDLVVDTRVHNPIESWVLLQGSGNTDLIVEHVNIKDKNHLM